MYQKVIVFSGPPCSGKSTLAENLARRLNLPHLQMDQIRTILLPHSQHKKADREVAYRAMHLLTEQLILHDVSVILDATYGPSEQRQSLEALIYRTHAHLYLIECRVPPDVAVSRFASLRSNHPAVDLTEERVRVLTSNFPYFDKGLPLDTTLDLPMCLQRIEEYVACGSPIEANGRWSSDLTPLPTSHYSRHTGIRLTERSRRGARYSLFGIRVALLLPFGTGLLGILPILLKSFVVFLIPQVEQVPMVRQLLQLSWSNVLAWGAFWLAVAVVGGAIVPVLEYLGRSKKAKIAIATAGNTPRYDPVSDPRP